MNQIINMSKHFKNIKVNADSELIMDIYGLDTSIVNSFRRIVLSDVECNAFDNIDIEKNTSIVNNEILSHRLGLIPLTLDDIDEVCVELNVKNTYEIIKKIYDERKNIYKLATYKINCNNLSKKNIVEKIIFHYEKH